MNYGIADYIVVGVVCGSVIWFIATGLIDQVDRRGIPRPVERLVGQSEVSE